LLSKFSTNFIFPIKNRNINITLKNNEKKIGYLHFIDPELNFIYIAPTGYTNSEENHDLTLINFEDIQFFECSSDIAYKQDFGEAFRTG